MGKCNYCHKRKGKRKCPVYETICSYCCGTHRVIDIECPEDCKILLEHKGYQDDRNEERELRSLIETVNPKVIGYDYLAKTETHSLMAYHIDSFFHSIDMGLSNYSKEINDEDVYKCLKNYYYRVFKGKEIPLSEIDEFFYSSINIGNDKWKDLPEYEQEKVILRLILSVRNFTGGIFGNRSYLNYLKHQFD